MRFDLFNVQYALFIKREDDFYKWTRHVFAFIVLETWRALCEGYFILPIPW